MKVDPSKTIAQVDAKIARTSNPRHRALLENFREHLSAEVEGGDNVDRLMKTQIADPQYHFWGMGIGDFGPKGGKAVAAHYQNVFDEGYHRLQHDLERIIVDDNNVFVDGELHILFPGKSLRKIGIQVDDADAAYVYSYRSATIFHYDDEGNCTGEDTYSDGAPTLERLKKVSP